MGKGVSKRNPQKNKTHIPKCADMDSKEWSPNIFKPYPPKMTSGRAASNSCIHPGCSFSEPRFQNYNIELQYILVTLPSLRVLTALFVCYAHMKGHMPPEKLCSRFQVDRSPWGPGIKRDQRLRMQADFTDSPDHSGARGRSGSCGSSKGQ